MARGRRLYKLAAILFAAAGMMMAAISPASAATGAGGLPILYASSQMQAHKCNVIGGDSNYQAVVCSDILTYEGATDYYAYGRAEAICQTTSTHTVVPCKYIWESTALAAGDGTSTGTYSLTCAAGSNYPCPNGRFYKSTRDWVYSIAHAGGGTCSSNTGSSYDLWDIVWGGSGIDVANIVTPDGGNYYLGSGNANDGHNESTGHYYICP